MSRKIFAALCFIALLPACCRKEKRGAKHTFFIQAPLDLPAIKQMQDTLRPVIDEIFKEELRIEQDKNFPLFFFKKRQAITIYYINNLYDSGDPIKGILYLFLFPALYSLHDALAPQAAPITSKLDFFGQPKAGLFSTLELVALIDDPQGELVSLNRKMRKAAHFANDEYKRAYHVDLYDRSKSEKYPYLPHISLGHLRVNYLKYLINDPSKENEIVSQIKRRIIEVVGDALAQIPKNERKVAFDKLAVYDLQKKKYIEDVTLGVPH